LTGGIGNIGGSNIGVSAGSSYGLFEHPLPKRSPSPLLGVRGDRLSLVSPNIGRRVKGHRVITGKLLQNYYVTLRVVFYFLPLLSARQTSQIFLKFNYIDISNHFTKINSRHGH